MGTGSAGGGGSGAGTGGSGSGNGGFGGLGHLAFDPSGGPPASTMQSATPPAGQTVREVTRERVVGILLAGSRRDYLVRQLCNQPARDAYRLVAILAEDPCKVDEDADGGFLYRHLLRLGEAWIEVEGDARYRDPVRSALEEFTFDLLGDAIDVYRSGDCDAVRASLVEDVRSEAAQHFLATFFWKLLEGEIEPLPDDDTQLLQEVCREIADEIADALAAAAEADESETAHRADEGVFLDASILEQMCELEIEGEPLIVWFLGQLTP